MLFLILRTARRLTSYNVIGEVRGGRALQKIIFRGACMKIIIVRSPAVIATLLRRVFGIKNNKKK